MDKMEAFLRDFIPHVEEAQARLNEPDWLYRIEGLSQADREFLREQAKMTWTENVMNAPDGDLPERQAQWWVRVLRRFRWLR